MLINELEDNPNCVLLLDEVEKAHPDIMSVLLALMDDGLITGSTGKKVSGKNCIIIMTSNLGARESKTKSIGFNKETINTKAINSAINNFFAPEFRNRLDAIIQFNALKPENMERIVIKFLRQIEGYVAGRNISIEWNESVLRYLEEKGFDSEMGARPLARLINEKIKLPLAKVILTDRNIDWVKISYDHDNDTIIVKSGENEGVLMSEGISTGSELETN